MCLILSGSREDSKNRLVEQGDISNRSNAVVIGDTTVRGIKGTAETSLLLLISTSSEHSQQHFANKPFNYLILACTILVPNVLAFAKALWKTSFGSSHMPPLSILLTVCVIEGIVALGTSLLILVSMPHFDILTNLHILSGVCFLPSILQIVFQLKPFKPSIFFPIAAFGFVFLGFVLFVTAHWQQEISGKTDEIQVYVGLTIVFLMLVSLNWWENFTSYCKSEFVENVKEKLRHSQSITNLCTNFIRILVTGLVVGVMIPVKKYNWNHLTAVSPFQSKIILSLFAMQGISSALCHWFGVIVCKMHAIRRGFIIPSLLTTPIVFFSFLIVLDSTYRESGLGGSFNLTSLCNALTFDKNSNPTQILLLEVSHSLCRTGVILDQGNSGLALIGFSGLSFWLGLLFSTFYVWERSLQRIERTTQLFVRRLYEAAFMEQSMLLNTRVEKKKYHSHSNFKRSQHVMIYLCATMWHETVEEMRKILTSMFRLDKYKPSLLKSHKDNFDFEAHIYFDDAFQMGFKPQENKQERIVNDYVKNLVCTIDEVFRIFSGESQTSVDQTLEDDEDDIKQTIMETPYGGRISYTLPSGNMLHVHLKDKDKIRHKKRWSQIMYLYYLLGWKLNRKYLTLSGKFEEETNITNSLETEKQNTYILALDGDTDFQPSSVILLVDRLRRYPHVGAACGRIHPTGTGPMVWYQKFEYAIGHWLQKTAEHVLGCVLCSPGCFSLFRAAALMDDNVVKRYTTKSTEAFNYIQYDQGEDRWLCTLLLQQGWRVEYNAASDAYTNAPQEFKEFYNQRRRWGPSTLANTIELLNSGAQTSRKNSSISKLYILYLIISTAASILGPATVILMIAGSFSFMFNWNAIVCLVLGVAPPAIFLVLCYNLKTDTQINIAAVLSIFYAFLMIGTLLSIIGDMVKANTFISPTGLFVISIALLYTITAMLHPQEFSIVFYGLLYIVCIPSGYLLLTIYSMVNMNNISWGTREAPTYEEKKEKVNRYEKNWKCLCWDIEFQVKEDRKELPQPSNSEDSQINDEVNELPTLEDNWVKNLQEQSCYIELIEEKLDEVEKPFWVDLIKLYLEPLNEDKAKQAEIKKDLKTVRNKATFLFFIINIFWIVATVFLQAIGTAIQITIPKILPNGSLSITDKLQVEPIGFMFLITFAGLLSIQFLAMLYHRIITLTHFVAYKGTQVKPAKAVGKYEKLNKDNEV
ncbi:chitin synthase chs-2-like [Callorhinchus milii]|uniref:chitin synthase chs-2-like n=1 Tax=Callorhinchus milii TaxID=7868 RepID=UPI001C3F8D4B|nr:chitin synthase chs-2-like [Callorhinchus milii]